MDTDTTDKLYDSFRGLIISFLIILIDGGLLKGSMIVLAKYFPIIPIFGYWELILLLWTIFALKNLFLVRKN